MSVPKGNLYESGILRYNRDLFKVQLSLFVQLK